MSTTGRRGEYSCTDTAERLKILSKLYKSKSDNIYLQRCQKFSHHRNENQIIIRYSKQQKNYAEQKITFAQQILVFALWL